MFKPRQGTVEYTSVDAEVKRRMFEEEEEWEEGEDEEWEEEEW